MTSGTEQGVSPDRAEAVEERGTDKTAVMFWLAFSFLAILALMLPHGGTDLPFYEQPLWHEMMPVVLFVIWALILVEGIVGYRSAPDRPKALQRLLLVGFLPPMRMTLAPGRPNDWVWLPIYGWQRVAVTTLTRMEQRTAGPMILATALILPVLIVDFGFASAVEASPALQFTLAALMSLIWFSFALEFAVMVALTPKKIAYCKKHWINLVIIILPIIAFLRSLQMFRFLKLARASKLAKVYRLRGLITRILKLALAFNLVERLLALSPERYCASLEEKIAETETELAELRAKLVDARRKLEEKAGTRAAAEAARDPGQ